MGFSDDIRTNVLTRCKRHCCLCGKYAGVYMELHHIDQKADGGADSEENCIPLCFNCHGEVRSYNSHHPKGLKYGVKELKIRRDEIYEAVKNQIIDIYSDSDVQKAKKLMDNYYQVLEALIYVDPCGMKVSTRLLDSTVAMMEHLQLYEFAFENKNLDMEKCTLIETAVGWVNLITDEQYFHEINDGTDLCFNANTISLIREQLKALRISFRISYWMFRTAVEKRVPFQ